jgi:RimJ/RimL family protein N-acetyltransferase
MVDVSGSHPRSLRPTYPVRGERLLLRLMAIGDADTLLAYRSREDVCRYVPFEPMSRDDIIERIAGQWARTELTDEEQSLTLGAQVGETSELAGDVVLFWRSRAHAGGELGYVFNPALGGRGYATEAANVMLRLGFEELTRCAPTSRTVHASHKLCRVSCSWLRLASRSAMCCRSATIISCTRMP